MTCWLVPETHLAANVKASKLFADRVIKRAHRLIAISEHTRSDAGRILGISPEKITVIYPGVAMQYFTAGDDSREVARRYGLLKSFILFVGTIEPRKNLVTLLEAYHGLPSSIRDEFELAVAGPQGWADAKLLRRLQAGVIHRCMKASGCR
jgi:alpha-1,3-rhamnosyl/mannosyltransferase